MSVEVSDFVARTDAVDRRLAAHREASHAGLTEPDAGDDERWEAAQIWAHAAEFIPYWIKEARHVIANYGGSPVAFGRTKRDLTRRQAIAAAGSLDDRWRAIEVGIADLRAFLASLRDQDWSVVGRHSTLGEMSLQRILDEFLVGHLEEHAAQLDGLRPESR